MNWSVAFCYSTGEFRSRAHYCRERASQRTPEEHQAAWLAWHTATPLVETQTATRPPGWTTRFLPQAYPHPFHFRHGTTDRYVIAEVLVREQYRCLLGIPEVGTILDAGANIGTASVYLLNAYPAARLIALEPDPGNFEVLCRNLAPYGPRAVCLQKALWHERRPLATHRHFGDGGNWSIPVEPATDGTVDSTTVEDLRREHGLSTIDILKMDIEGAELHVLGRDATTWLGRVRVLAVELHDDDCRKALADATASFPARTSRHGEVTLWRRLG